MACIFDSGDVRIETNIEHVVGTYDLCAAVMSDRHQKAFSDVNTNNNRLRLPKVHIWQRVARYLHAVDICVQGRLHDGKRQQTTPSNACYKHATPLGTGPPRHRWADGGPQSDTMHLTCYITVFHGIVPARGCMYDIIAVSCHRLFLAAPLQQKTQQLHMAIFSCYGS
jgi:hypothetical protein